MNIRLILLSHLAFVISLNVWAQKPHFGEKKRSKRITKHITYLASDELGGRLSASDNDRKSAEYVAKQYERIGLEPAGPRATRATAAARGHFALHMYAVG